MDIVDLILDEADSQRQERALGHLLVQLKPSKLATIDGNIQLLIHRVEKLVATYEAVGGFDTDLAFGGDLLNDPPQRYEGLQALVAIWRTYSSVVNIYLAQKEMPSQLVKLPEDLDVSRTTVEVTDGGQPFPISVGEFVPDIWNGHMPLVAAKLDAYFSTPDNIEDPDWQDQLTPKELRTVWEKLKRLIPTSRCIDMAKMRSVLKTDRQHFTSSIIKGWKILKQPERSDNPSKNTLYKWATTPSSSPYLPITAGTEADALYNFIEQLHGLAQADWGSFI